MSANHRFSLTANACAYPLEVLAFSGDEAISTPYSFDIELVCERSDLNLEAALESQQQALTSTKQSPVCIACQPLKEGQS